jgi:hypothetical protein
MKKSEESFDLLSPNIFKNNLIKGLKMRIAVEEWELYNNGILLCKWFDTEFDTKVEYNLNNDDIEMFIADFEGETLGLISGDESVEEAYIVSEQIEPLSDYEIVAIKLMLDAGIVTNTDEAIEHIDYMISTGESKMEDVAYNYIEECGLLSNMPENLQGYFDYESLGRDMEINGSYYEDDKGIIWEFVA